MLLWAPPQSLPYPTPWKHYPDFCPNYYPVFLIFSFITHVWSFVFGLYLNGVFIWILLELAFFHIWCRCTERKKKEEKKEKENK